MSHEDWSRRPARRPMMTTWLRNLLPSLQLVRNGNGENRVKFRAEVSLDSVLALLGMLAGLVVFAWRGGAVFNSINQAHVATEARVAALERRAAAELVGRSEYDGDRKAEAEWRRGVDRTLNEIKQDVRDLMKVR